MVRRLFLAMNKPKVGKAYIFVRRRGDSFEHTEYVRHKDGSSGFLADGHFKLGLHPDYVQAHLLRPLDRGRTGVVFDILAHPDAEDLLYALDRIVADPEAGG